MKKLTLLLLVFLPILLAAQSTATLKSDSLFFKEKAKDYDKWLKESGLGRVLRVAAVHFVNSDIISLDLVFYTENQDSVTVLWRNLKADYEKQDRGLSLEKELYYKMLYFMEVKPSQGYLQVFDSYNPSKDICFRRSMAFLENKFLIDSANCKAAPQEFVVESVNLTNLRAVPKGDVSKKMSKEAVFSKIKKLMETRFTQQKCENRTPKIEWTNTNDALTFTVANLCKEVLTDETNPWWCNVLSPMCGTCKNCTKREFLSINIEYTPLATGYRIKIMMDAKIGSGWYNEVRRGAYKNMESDYKKWVDDYTKKFKDQLLTELKKN
jgi:hypothetical protein